MAALTLDSLKSSNGTKKGRRSSSAPSRSASAVVQRKSAKSADGHEVRDTQVKAACRPSEKPIFEALAENRGETLSNFIYLYLVKEAKKEGLL